MQLINTAIYDQEAQTRAKAIEETRRLRAQQKADREKAKVLKFAQYTGAAAPVVTTATPNAGNTRPESYKITIHDIPFQVAKGGSKLIRLSSEIVSSLLIL